MGKECITSCPRIKKIVSDIRGDNSFAGPLLLHPDTFSSDDDSGVGRLLRACRDTYGCDGPVTKQVSVEKGFFRRRIVVENKIFCGLDTQTATNSQPVS